MSGPSKRKNYTPAYRREAAHLVIDTGWPIVQVAREIGVGEALLGRCIAYERAKTDHPPEALDVDERDELARLRIECRAADGPGVPKNSGLLCHRESRPVEVYRLMDAGRPLSRSPGWPGC